VSNVHVYVFSKQTVVSDVKYSFLRGLVASVPDVHVSMSMCSVSRQWCLMPSTVSCEVLLLVYLTTCVHVYVFSKQTVVSDVKYSFLRGLVASVPDYMCPCLCVQ